MYISLKFLDAPIFRKRKKKKKTTNSNISDAQLDAIRQIFGTDAIDDLEYGDDDLVEDQLMDLDPQEQIALLHEKLKEVYEPDQLDAAFMSKSDDKIRNTDKPERLQLRYGKRYSYLLFNSIT